MPQPTKDNTPSTIQKPTVETEYPISHHLHDLRKRVVRIFICVLIIFVACYKFSKVFYEFFTAPIVKLLPENAQLSMFAITEGFLMELRVSFLSALFISMPFILFQMWQFIAPGLYRNERRYVVGFVLSATLFFFIGASFAYYMVFPLGFKFFLKFASPEWHLAGTFSISLYLTFVLKMLLAFGVVFELPVVVFFLAKVGIITSDTLVKYRRFAIVGIFAVAAVITPPDVISQLAMAVPLVILYEISIWITRIFGKKKKVSDMESIYD